MIDLQDKDFDYTISSEFTVLGMTEAGSMEIDNSGVTFNAELSFDTGWIGCSQLSTGFDVSAQVDLTLSFQTNGDVTFSFDASASMALEVFGSNYSWSGGLDYSTTFNLDSIGASLWDDIKNGFVSDVEDNLLAYV